MFTPTAAMPVHVHISNLAAQTGASLFLQINSSPYPPTSLVSAPSNLKAPLEWTYDKTENRTDFTGFSYVISERREGWDEGMWEEVVGVEAFSGIRFGLGGDGHRGQGPFGGDTDNSIIRRTSGRWRMLEKRVPRVVVEERLWIFRRRTSGAGETAAFSSSPSP